MTVGSRGSSNDALCATAGFDEDEDEEDEEDDDDDEEEKSPMTDERSTMDEAAAAAAAALRNESDLDAAALSAHISPIMRS
jgi:hypothetical protein